MFDVDILGSHLAGIQTEKYIVSSDVTGGRFTGIGADGASPRVELMSGAVGMDNKVSSAVELDETLLWRTGRDTQGSPVVELVEDMVGDDDS